MTAAIYYPEIRWKNQIIVSTRRQRRTGKTIFRTKRISDCGDVYLEFGDPVRLAEHLVSMMQLGCQVEWEGRLHQRERTAEIVPLVTADV